MDTYYKVVNKFGTGLFSVSADIFWIVGYEIGKKAVPHLENSKLFVFKDLDKARNWWNSLANRNLALYECQVENPVPAPYCAADCLKRFWQAPWTPDSWFVLHAPDGTYWADSVTLTKLVQEIS